MTVPVFVSFYTPEYESESTGLVASLRQVGIPDDQVHVQAVGSRGNWHLNCARKCEFLTECLRKFDVIVWLDADARTDQDPRPYFGTIPGSVDFGAHWRAGQELLSGTLYLRRSVETEALLGLWNKVCKENPDVWDQKCLQRVVHAVMSLKLVNLPPELCCIPDIMRGVKAIVRHRQASRKLKMLVGP